MVSGQEDAGVLLKKRAAAMGLRRRCGDTAPVLLPFSKGPWVRNV